MIKVLCFGDSNTWGAIPKAMRRYDASQRWPTILADRLSEHCEIIEEGLAGRTVACDDPAEQARNAHAYLGPCLSKHRPDVVLVLLGTNDLKQRFALSTRDIADAVSRLLERILNVEQATSPKVLLIAPPPIHEVGAFKRMFAGGAEKSQGFAADYQRIAQTLGCAFFDAGSVISSCEKEGIHWQADQHQLLAEALTPVVKQLLIDEPLIA